MVKMKRDTIFLKSIVVALALIFALVIISACKTSISKEIGIPYVKNAEKSSVVELSDKEIFSLEAKPVIKEIDGNKIRMYAYNGQIPGPLLKVKQGSTIYINFTNNIDMETAIHWHGIRLENKYDGVPDITQKPIKSGESFLYKLDFPDEGMYWYHPHLREDLQQELGLYGNIFVEPKDEDYFNKVDSEVSLFLDDIQIYNGDVSGFNANYADQALMGRFGNVMLVNGETNYKINAKEGDIIRFYITNSANTRIFNFFIENHELKLIGSDGGKYEKESFVNSVIISPSERYIFEVYFENEGTYTILHKTPTKTYELGTITVLSNKLDNNKNKKSEFLQLKNNNDIISETEKYKKYINSEPDFEFELTVDMSMMGHGMMGMQSSQPIEWEDDMAMMNAMATSKNTKWIIKDKKTGMQNMKIKNEVKLGEIKKIRLFNNPNSMHPMQHPMHLHGQQFLVTNINGNQNDNLVWKDTVLVPSGSTVDILVDFSNPGKWMMHCHIAEHLEAGMMTLFEVV